MDPYLKELEVALLRIQEKFSEDLRAVRSGRPSAELVDHIKVEYFGQFLPMNQIGTLAVVPPREIRISVWDKGAVPAVAKAIEEAQVGLSVAVDGNVIHATLSALSAERRDELTKLVKKMTESARIEVRGARENAVKKVKAAADRSELTEDDVADAKEKIQKKVDAANGALEAALEKKITELSE